MLWRQYVFRRGQEVYNTWNRLFERRPIRLLFISGRGFDLRAQQVMNAFMENVRESRQNVQDAKLLLVGFTGYQLSPELNQQTEENAKALEECFAKIGRTETVSIGSAAFDEEDISGSMALRLGANAILGHLADHTDVVLDVSSLPRVVYLALLT